jgi:hypothetical protein
MRSVRSRTHTSTISRTKLTFSDGLMIATPPIGIAGISLEKSTSVRRGAVSTD